MAKLRRVYLGFSALLVFCLVSLILTYAELTAIYSEDLTRSEPNHWMVAAEWKREDKHLARARVKAVVEGQPAPGLNVGRVLAKYDSDELEKVQRDDTHHDAVNESVQTLHPPRVSSKPPSSQQPRETDKSADLDWQKNLNEQVLYQRQLALQLNWTARVISSSSHFRDVKNRLSTLAHLKNTELRLDTGTKELWSYLRHQLNSIEFTQRHTVPDVAKTKILNSVKEQLDLLSLHASDMRSIVDSYINEGWREKMSTELTQLMQRRLHYLQNPENCQSAKKLLCRISKPCGFGCQIHHAAYCFIFAYATERMLVLDSSGWRYSGKWEGVFQPLSNTPNCTRVVGAVDWNAYNDPTPPLAIRVPSIDTLSGANKPPFLPMAVPSDLIDRLKVFHGYPFVWFIGQFLQYLMRPSLQLRRFLDERRAHLNISHPIVGVHIRRTDKLKSEASYHSVEEYMIQVEEWYDWRRTTLGEKGAGKQEKRVYLATDDKSALSDAMQSYPDYTFISDNEVSRTAGELNSRYSEMGLFGVILDVLMLSECDYIVCTFSSQVCRLAYELMQQHHTDASRLAYSLDDVYYYGGQHEHLMRAFHGRTDKGGGRMDIAEGDFIKIAGNDRNGFSLGTKKGRSAREPFPSYKAEEELLVVNFPSYPEVL